MMSLDYFTLNPASAGFQLMQRCTKITYISNTVPLGQHLAQCPCAEHIPKRCLSQQFRAELCVVHIRHRHDWVVDPEIDDRLD